jgi:hypothetical protein
MTIYSTKLLDENKVVAWVAKWNREQDERLYIRRTVQPVIEKWEGKKPTVIMKNEIRAALTGPNESESRYIVTGPKDYDWQRWSIYGRLTWGDNPTSLIDRDRTVYIDLGRLKNHNLTLIQKEAIETAKADIERLEKDRDKIKALLDSTARPIQMAVQSWNEAISRAQTIEKRMEAYGLSYLFSGTWDRSYDIYQ